jgi:FkbM family methyltransferase
MWLSNNRLTGPVWRRLWGWSRAKYDCTVSCIIHGYKAILPYGHMYPIHTRTVPNYNNPLVELVYECYRAKERPITVVDVGANIGDTMLLIESKCPKMVSKAYCVEGDPEFFEYLKLNLRRLPHAKPKCAMLSAAATSAPALVRTPLGSATATGAGQAQAVTLDDLLLPVLGETTEAIDLIKSDIDGFDGKALAGASDILATHRPAVIFEWHPNLCNRTGNSWYQHFETLSDLGYTTFVWYTKFGNFSHFMSGCDRPTIQMHADLCLQSKVLGDWHFDVIALHAESTLSPNALAEMAYAAHRRSAC